MQAPRPGPRASWPCTCSGFPEGLELQLLQGTGRKGKASLCVLHLPSGERDLGLLRAHPPGDRAETSSPAWKLYFGLSEVSVSTSATSWWVEAASRGCDFRRRVPGSPASQLWLPGYSVGEPRSPAALRVEAWGQQMPLVTLNSWTLLSASWGFGQVSVWATRGERQISCPYPLSSAPPPHTPSSSPRR